MEIQLIIAFAFVVGPLIYIVAILSSAPPKNYNEFHFAQRNIEPSEFIDSTVMYGLQVAAISLFAIWGFKYGFWTLLVPLFWGTGYFLLIWVLQRNPVFFQRFVTTDKFGTLHQFISRGHRYPLIAAIAALVTLTAIAGPAMFEVVYVSELAMAHFGEPQVNNWIVIAFFMLAISLFYMVRGGFLAVVQTDKIQLAIGYGLFNVFIAAFNIIFVGPQNAGAAIALAVLSVAVSTIILFLLRRSIHAFAARDTLGTISTWLGVLSHMIGLVILISNYGVSAIGSGSVLTTFLQENLATPMTPLAFLSLFIANGLYQLVDVGQWQRLLSVKVDRQNLGLS